jgi:2-hydroxychromene-2-carboxylate isomerase
MPEIEGEPPELKLYFDYKSPFSYLALQPALELPERHAVRLRCIPFPLRIKGSGQRSVYSEWKVRYSYLDARRAANRRGGLRILGPRKVYDSTPALIGGLYAQGRGFFRAYSEAVFARFFERRLEIDLPDAIAGLVDELGDSAAGYRAFLAGEGPRALEASLAEAHADCVFGVPLVVFRGEQFWGQDRIPLLEERLRGEYLSR